MTPDVHINLKGHPNRSRRLPFDIWQTGGVTEHLGGAAATRRLLAWCAPVPGQRALDIGCGTGYTACVLAQGYGVQVAASDRLAGNLARTSRRALKAGVAACVRGVCADAHALPFPDGHFDLVVAESLLAFCDAPRVATEIRRVLKPGGLFGGNEFTLLRPPPAELQALLADTCCCANRRSGHPSSLMSCGRSQAD